MGSGGSGSGLTAGKRTRFTMPEFSNGSEKQQAWAGRILQGFDQAFDQGVQNARDRWKSEAKYYTGEDEKLWANRRDDIVAAIRDAQTEYRKSVVAFDAYANATTVINSRDELARNLQRLTYQFFRKRGIVGADLNLVHSYVPFKASR